MEQYLRTLQHLKHAPHHGGGPSHAIRKFKKIIIVAVIIAIIAVVSLAVLAVVAVSWLFNRGSDEIKQAGQGIVEQVQPTVSVPSLDLASYVVDGQVVRAEQLEQTFTALPAQLQDAWLAQFQSQLQELQNQVGVTDETIQSLNSTYRTLQSLQGE